MSGETIEALRIENAELYDRIADLNARVEEAYAAGRRDAVPEGYVLVPVEPTVEMVRAAFRLDLSYMPGQESADRVAVYKAMLAAAQQEKSDG